MSCTVVCLSAGWSKMLYISVVLSVCAPVCACECAESQSLEKSAKNTQLVNLPVVKDTSVRPVTIWKVHPRNWWCSTLGAEVRLRSALRRPATATMRRRRQLPLWASLQQTRRKKKVPARRRGAVACRSGLRRPRRPPHHPCWARPTGPPPASAARLRLWVPVAWRGEQTEELVSWRYASDNVIGYATMWLI